jgi:SSS family solute:Na+ symporter
VILSGVYLLKGGYKSDLYINVYQFIIMFVGFIIAVIVSIKKYGGFIFLENNLPASHLRVTGNVSVVYIIVWFLIALWTFADPGFHQRCYAAKTGDVAKRGILISIILFAAFDFLTTTTGLYSKAVLPNLTNPVLSFPYYAEKALGSGVKGLFYAAMFATIMSTLNSFLFLSATTFGRDFIFKLSKSGDENRINYYTRIGLIVSSFLAILIAYLVQSVISIWYVIGSICIPPIIILIAGAYFEKFRIGKRLALVEIIVSVGGSILWLLIRDQFPWKYAHEIEPMIIGLLLASSIHLIGMRRKKRLQFETAL